MIGAKSGDREDWNDCKSFLHFGSRFAEPPEPRQCGGQKEMCAWKLLLISNGAAHPRDRFFLVAKVEFRQTGEQTPQVGSVISRTEAQRLRHVSFGLLRSAQQSLAIANLNEVAEQCWRTRSAMR